MGLSNRRGGQSAGSSEASASIAGEPANLINRLRGNIKLPLELNLAYPQTIYVVKLLKDLHKCPISQQVTYFKAESVTFFLSESVCIECSGIRIYCFYSFSEFINKE